MSVYKPKKSRFYQYDFVWKDRRFHGSTGATDREAAKVIEAGIRYQLVNETLFGTKSEMTLDAAAGRYWLDIAKEQASAGTTEYQLRNLIARIGAETKLS